MVDLELETASKVNELNRVTNTHELRRDLHIFIRYVRERDVKRSVRTNELSKADMKWLAKLMGYKDVIEEVKEYGRAPWIDFIDNLALIADFVKYDLKGEYIGYSSCEPSFQDNYIEFRKERYEEFLESSQLAQENILLNTLIKTYQECNSEFFRMEGPLSILDHFNSSGCAVYVVPHIRFDKVRMFLLNQLKDLQAGTWYDTGSFIKYLKKNHRYFMIPKDIPDDWDIKEDGRYSNFKEWRGQYRNIKMIPENARDSFERVEGRFIERFLENIPLTMRYVDVAYDAGYESVKNEDRLWNDRKGDDTLHPSIGVMKAFRINDRFIRAMEGRIGEQKVTIQPNFEIHVDSALYPASLISQLEPFTDRIRDDTTILLKLSKKKISKYLVEDKDMDIIGFLKNISGKEVPANILTELKEWNAHTEIFTLYEGYGLLEGGSDKGKYDDFVVEEISPDLKIIRSPDALFSKMERDEVVPIKIKHPMDRIQTPPTGAQSVLGRYQEVKQKDMETIGIEKVNLVSYHFGSREMMRIVSKRLLKEGLLIEISDGSNSLSFRSSIEPLVKKVLRKMKYEIMVKDEETK